MPCGAVLHPEFLGQLQCADAFARRQYRVDGEYPVLQRALRGVHAGVGGDGELLAAVLVPVVARLARRLGDVLDAAAVRADRLAFPTGILEPCVAGVLVGEHAEQPNDADRLGDPLAVADHGAVLLELHYRHCHRLPSECGLLYSQWNQCASTFADSATQFPKLRGLYGDDSEAIGVGSLAERIGGAKTTTKYDEHNPHPAEETHRLREGCPRRSEECDPASRVNAHAGGPAGYWVSREEKPSRLTLLLGLSLDARAGGGN